ncbi:MAG: hypothetical protein EKK51_27970 [Mycolicibacterium sp.]|uniref:hypothetical protein n=1 Tax=Mycolicibacterium sp. TaxID=2320850 RepID=UPI000FBAC902|nr:hypothetical protein [Mycolicibacterium sp.]RUP27149.1 MAG: hypothetical protein EKK51_27970 [Mycolicibacterium sp.]
MSADHESDEIEIEIDVPSDEFDELKATLADRNVEVLDVRSVTDDIGMVVNIATILQMGYTSTKFARAKVKGRRDAVVGIKNESDRKLGGYLVYKNDDAVLDTRTNHLNYGLVRAVGTQQFLDIDASDRFVDAQSGRELVDDVKDEYDRFNGELRDLGVSVKRWAGVRQVRLFDEPGQPATQF